MTVRAIDARSDKMRSGLAEGESAVPQGTHPNNVDKGTDAMSEELKRTPAQFFFECGYGAAWADAFMENGQKPAFTLSDAAIERAWAIAPEAHDDPAEWERNAAALSTPQPAEARGIVEALEQAANWFEEYAVQHERKAISTDDSRETVSRMDKAKRNAERAAYLRATLSPQAGGGEASTANIRAAIELLANTQMNLPLADWSAMSAEMLAACDELDRLRASPPAPADNAGLVEVAQRLAAHFANATGNLTADYGEVSGNGFQMMTMESDPERLASDLNQLPQIAAALSAPADNASLVEKAARIIQSWRNGNAGEDTAHDTALLVLSALRANGAEREGWQDIASAPKDRTVIWAVLRDDLHILHPGRDDLERWNGLQVPLRHPGVEGDGFDIGWNIAAPVGHGGFPDSWIAGWRYPPTPPTNPKGDEA